MVPNCKSAENPIQRFTNVFVCWEKEKTEKKNRFLISLCFQQVLAKAKKDKLVLGTKLFPLSFFVLSFFSRMLQICFFFENCFSSNSWFHFFFHFNFFERMALSWRENPQVLADLLTRENRISEFTFLVNVGGKFVLFAVFQKGVVFAYFIFFELRHAETSSFGKRLNSV